MEVRLYFLCTKGHDHPILTLRNNFQIIKTQAGYEEFTDFRLTLNTLTLTGIGGHRCHVVFAFVAFVRIHSITTRHYWVRPNERLPQFLCTGVRVWSPYLNCLALLFSVIFLGY